MIDRQKVLSIVREKGPVIPRDIVRELGGDTILTGAVLSELLDKKQIKLSHAKIGGSPVYYSEGQEEKLQDLYNYLHEKEKKAYDLLKINKVIKDRSADPALRVALRNIKDFARPLEVNINGEREIFWKWYFIPNSEAEGLIREMLGVTKRETPEPKPTAEKKEEKKEEKKTEEHPVMKQNMAAGDRGLLAQVDNFFRSKDIEVIETETIRKNSEIDMLIKLPSPVGKLSYFCKIRNKKKSNDKDLSSAYVEGQVRKLPVLYMTTGELTNKAKEKLEKEFRMISVVYLDGN